MLPAKDELINSGLHLLKVVVSDVWQDMAAFYVTALKKYKYLLAYFDDQGRSSVIILMKGLL